MTFFGSFPERCDGLASPQPVLPQVQDASGKDGDQFAAALLRG